MSIKQILVPTDLSECANDALRVAADLAQKSTGTVIHLLHTFNETPQVVGYRQKVIEKVKGLCEQEFLDGVKVHRHIIPGKRIWQVLKSSAFNDIDVIVMGTHGIHQDDKWFMGSNTQKVVQFAEVPVLVVKGYVQVEDINDLIYTSKFDNISIEAYGSMFELIKALHVHVRLLKVITPDVFQSTEDSEAQMRDFARGVGLDRYETNVYNARSVVDGVMEFTQDDPDALIAMDTQGVFGLGHFFFNRSAGPMLA